MGPLIFWGGIAAAYIYNIVHLGHGNWDLTGAALIIAGSMYMCGYSIATREKRELKEIAENEKDKKLNELQLKLEAAIKERDNATKSLKYYK
jgi:hypothetical protein